MKNFRSRTLFLVIVVGLSLRCGGARDEALTLYTSLDSQEAPVYIRAFEEDTGIRVEMVRLSAGEALARLEAEKGNPQVSVWFGGPAPEYNVAAQRGLLERFEPQLDFEIPASMRGATWEWTGFYFGAIGFACNETFLRAQSVPCPSSWQGLLEPAFKGQISVAYPYTSGTAYVAVVALLELFGDSAGWDYIRALDKQVHHYNSSGSAAVTQVGLGEVAVGIAFAHDILKKGKARGYPVTLSLPREGTASEIGGVALIKGGPQPELGRRFITWLHGEHAQNLLAEFYRVPLNPKAKVAEGAVRAADVTLIDYDALQAAQRQPEILARWRQVTGR
jgi:iron(III) transport system substrate-binding protein